VAAAHKAVATNKNLKESTYMNPSIKNLATTQHNKSFRVGIIGGMGPLAGVELHRLIIDATPAKKDQDHIEVLLYTNPLIPDRTQSLREDDGESFAAAAARSAQLLEHVGVDIIAMACMTAHSRLAKIRASVNVPVLNGIDLVHSALRRQFAGEPVALLATKGSVASQVFTQSAEDISWMLPDTELQDYIQKSIYDYIKAGDELIGITMVSEAMRLLRERGAKAFILGCTELGLLHDGLQQYGYQLVEPLRLLAQEIVILCGKAERQESLVAHSSVELAGQNR
jgi:aspartate racemase